MAQSEITLTLSREDVTLILDGLDDRSQVLADAIEEDLSGDGNPYAQAILDACIELYHRIEAACRDEGAS